MNKIINCAVVEF